MLLVKNLSFYRNQKIIFENIDFSLSPNKIIHLKGSNGVGKTTLLKILTKGLQPQKGEIFWQGKNIFKNSSDYFQNLTYIMDINTSKKEMTVIENINFWKKLFSSKINSKELDSVLKILSIEKYENSLVSTLSKGEFRKLELCRLVIEQKKLWLLDEPYSDIDNESIELLTETFKNHIKSNGMIIFSSHHNPELQNTEVIEIKKNYETL
tara:strand:+ start:174 stop:800 length:627 start_codon:yes stop_codon:yes gene_type:complete